MHRNNHSPKQDITTTIHSIDPKRCTQNIMLSSTKLLYTLCVATAITIYNISLYSFEAPTGCASIGLAKSRSLYVGVVGVLPGRSNAVGETRRRRRRKGTYEYIYILQKASAKRLLGASGLLNNSRKTPRCVLQPYRYTQHTYTYLEIAVLPYFGVFCW